MNLILKNAVYCRFIWLCTSALSISLLSISLLQCTASYNVSVNGERHLLSCVAVTFSQKSTFPRPPRKLGEQACPQSER